MSDHTQQHNDHREAVDLIGAILVDHLDIQDLFGEVRAAQGTEKRRDAFDRLVRKLMVHEAAEEAIVHPLTEEADGGRRIGERRVHEELQAERMVSKMIALDPSEREFDTKLDLLESAVLRHATKEEGQEHPLLQQTIEPARLRHLGEVYRMAQESAQACASIPPGSEAMGKGSVPMVPPARLAIRQAIESN